LSLTFKKPKKACEDVNCPFHGELPIRGRVFEGVVVTAKMEKTVVVERDYLSYISKFMRFERRRSRIPSHNPPCIDAREGDRVMVAETRPISKTVSFVVVEKLEGK
jgi:small subunit ribosomal protein S17